MKGAIESRQRGETRVNSEKRSANNKNKSLPVSPLANGKYCNNYLQAPQRLLRSKSHLHQLRGYKSWRKSRTKATFFLCPRFLPHSLSVISICPLFRSTCVNTLTLSQLFKMPRRMTPQQQRQCYEDWQNRPGPQAIGTQEWPAPTPGSLSNQKYIVTGVPETIERSDLENIIRGSSGTVSHGRVPKGATGIIVGRDAGPVKLEMAKEYGVPVYSEDTFRNHLERSADPSSSYSRSHRPK